MKRIGNLYEKIIDVENLKLADKKARRGKSKQYGVKSHLKRESQNIEDLKELLNHRKFKTSKYSLFMIYEPKERIISRLPYYPDRIVQQAVVNIIEPIFYSIFTADSYSCIKGRGVHKASYDLRKYLKDEMGTKYALKLDIKKFYPSVNNKILKEMLRWKFKDRDLLKLLDEVIDSCVGLPLGNLLSQFLANYYLTWFDHYVKEILKLKYYQRFCDDIVILSNDKNMLHTTFENIKDYFHTNLKLEIKSNYQIFPVEGRGIDWCGFLHYHRYTKIRKSIKKNYIRSRNRENWNGWLIHGNTINLRRKYEQ